MVPDTLVLQYSFLVRVSVYGGILIMLGSSWEENVITPITFECILPHIKCDKHTYEVGMAHDMAILFNL
jgi:hypothetical protein